MPQPQLTRLGVGAVLIPLNSDIVNPILSSGCPKKELEGEEKD